MKYVSKINKDNFNNEHSWIEKKMFRYLKDKFLIDDFFADRWLEIGWLEKSQKELVNQLQ